MAAQGNASRAGMAMLRAYPMFTRLWVGQLVSRLGDALDSVAFIWVVLELTGSTLLMGTVMVVNMLPSIMLSPVAGVWVDRWRRRTVMIACDLARAVTTAAIAWLYVVHQLEVWHLFVVTAVNSSLEAFSQPARAAAMPLLVEEQDWVTANSLESVASSMASLFGLVLAAPIFAWLGIAWAIGVDAATFLFAGLTAVVTAIPELQRAGSERVGQATSATGGRRGPLITFLRELAVGVHLVWAHRVLAYLILLAGISNFALGPLNVLMPVYVKQELGLGVEQLTNVYIGFTVGMLVSGYLVGRWAKRWSERELLWLGLGIVGAGYAALYWGYRLGLVVGLAVVIGSGVPPAQAGLQTLVQKNTPNEMMGRVSALMGSLMLAAMPLSMAVAGAVAEWVAVRVVFGVLGLLVLLVAGVILTRPELRATAVAGRETTWTV
ncbi:MAG: MFS transporter [Limnochordaceae bacterium]|nr:MFS transporter [Limnochordaceae bacterium]